MSETKQKFMGEVAARQMAQEIKEGYSPIGHKHTAEEIGADAAGSAAAALSLAEQNTQTKIDELSSSVDGKLSGKADSNHNHNAREIIVSSPFDNTGNSVLDTVLEDFDSAISQKASSTHIHNSDNVTYAGASGNIIGKGDTLTTILQGYDQKMAGVEGVISSHSHSAENINFSAKNFSSGSVANVQTAIEHVDERLAIINGELSQSIEEISNNKADKEHSHAISDVTDLQTKLDAKADSNHNHDTKYDAKGAADEALDSSKAYTDESVESLSDGFSNVIYQMYGDDFSEDSTPTIRQIAADEASKVQTDLNETSDELTQKIDSHTGNGDIHFTAEERAKLSGIESGAQKNTLTGIKGSAETTYRTGNVSITAANIGLGNVNNTSDANKPVSTAQKTAIDNSLASANAYTDEKVALLLNNSSSAVDSIMELATAMEENDDVVSALEEAIGNKADSNHTHTYTIADIKSTNAPWEYINGSDAEDLLLDVDAKLLEVNSKATSANSSITTHSANSTIHVTQTEKNTWNSKAAGTHDHDAKNINVDPLSNHSSSNVQSALEALETDITNNTNRINDLADSKVDTATLTANYYTKTQIDSLELITVDDIDAICGTTIQLASEVTF